MERELAGQLAQELLLVHSILESFSAIDEDDRDLVVELATEIHVRVDINFAPGKSATARKLGKALFHDFTQVATFTGIDDDTGKQWHAGVILAPRNREIPDKTASAAIGQKHADEASAPREAVE